MLDFLPPTIKDWKKGWTDGRVGGGLSGQRRVVAGCSQQWILVGMQWRGIWLRNLGFLGLGRGVSMTDRLREMLGGGSKSGSGCRLWAARPMAMAPLVRW